jgi:hypothetical protein
MAMRAMRPVAWSHKHRIHVVMVGVGTAFDFHAGVVKRAPTWMQPRGLEWCYRILQDPRRLAQKYLVSNTIFIMAWLGLVWSGRPAPGPRRPMRKTLQNGDNPPRLAVTTSWDVGHPADLRLADLLSEHGGSGTSCIPNINAEGTAMQFFPHSDDIYVRNYLSGCPSLKRLMLLRAVLGGHGLLDQLNRAADLCLRRGGCFHIWQHSWELSEYDLWDELVHFLAHLRQLRAHLVINWANWAHASAFNTAAPELLP